jgi:glycine betaine/proline transport system ATP-binding protein
MHKTIVFITHDFVEALRLGDRIAIMRDGRFVQVGTPQELVLNPQNDYVTAFTKDAPRAKVLTAASVMGPHPAGAAAPEASDGALQPDTRLEDCIPRVVASPDPLPVFDRDQCCVGWVDRAGVLQALAG